MLFAINFRILSIPIRRKEKRRNFRYSCTNIYSKNSNQIHKRKCPERLEWYFQLQWRKKKTQNEPINGMSFTNLRHKTFDIILQLIKDMLSHFLCVYAKRTKSPDILNVCCCCCCYTRQLIAATNGFNVSSVFFFCSILNKIYILCDTSFDVLALRARLVLIIIIERAQ